MEGIEIVEGVGIVEGVEVVEGIEIVGAWIASSPLLLYVIETRTNITRLSNSNEPAKSLSSY